MRLVLMCDYGLDDAAATWDAVSHARADGYTSVDLIAIGGNVPSEVALRNAKKLAAAFDFDFPPLTIVDTTAKAQPSEYLAEIHGGDGMGDLFQEGTPNAAILPFSVWLEGLEEDYDLLSLGPMTLVPAALSRRLPERFVFMGGNIAEEPNFHGYEFNHALNRAAFTEATQKYAHIAVTMDTCRNPLFNVQEKEIAPSDMMRRIIARSRELTFTSGEKGCYIWDDIAIKALRHPEWFRLSTAKDRDGNVLTVAQYVGGKEYLEIIDL